MTAISKSKSTKNIIIGASSHNKPIGWEEGMEGEQERREAERGREMGMGGILASSDIHDLQQCVL